MATQRTFYGLLEIAWERSLVCVGLDPDLEKFPDHLKAKYKYVPLDKDGKNVQAHLHFTQSNAAAEMIEEFNREIILTTQNLVCAFKMNWAQYLACGYAGFRALKRTIEYIRIYAPHAVVILDAKPGDGDNTNKFYVRAAYDELGADVVTGNPYMGGYDTFAPFLERTDKGVIFLCKTSNPDSGTLQDLKVNGGMPLYMKVAHNVMKWNRNRNCALVVGATYPTALANVRNVIGDSMAMLCPGVGRQGGDPGMTARAGKDSRGKGIIISSSSNVTYASTGEDFAQKSRLSVLRLISDITPGLIVERRKRTSSPQKR